MSGQKHAKEAARLLAAKSTQFQVGASGGAGYAPQPVDVARAQAEALLAIYEELRLLNERHRP